MVAQAIAALRKHESELVGWLQKVADFVAAKTKDKFDERPHVQERTFQASVSCLAKTLLAMRELTLERSERISKRNRDFVVGHGALERPPREKRGNSVEAELSG